MFDGIDMEEKEQASVEAARVEQALSSALASSLQRHTQADSSDEEGAHKPPPLHRQMCLNTQQL